MPFQTAATTVERSRTRGAALILLLGLLLAGLVSAPPTLAYGGDGLRAAANGYRTQYGLAPVVGLALLDDIATARAADMVRNNDLEHDMTYVRNRMNSAGLCWTGFGEIIAWSRGGDYSYDRTMSQWWNSPTHQAIMMGSSYNAAGGAWKQHADGGYYSVMVFVDLCASVPAEPDPYGDTPFTDIASSPFRNDITWLYNSGITAGCDTDSFCPTAPVSRAQMASFLDRALGLPATSRDFFTDDDGSMHEKAINRLAAAGITNGCGDGRYCPAAGVSRQEMASFLVRATDLNAGGGLDLFDDDDWSMHERDIDRLAYGGVTYGCADRLYCPTGTVNREQMAAFLRRAFGG